MFTRIGFEVARRLADLFCRLVALVSVAVLGVGPVLGETHAGKTARSVVLVAEGRSATRYSAETHESFLRSFAQRFQDLSGEQVEVGLLLPGGEPQPFSRPVRIAYEIDFEAFRGIAGLAWLDGYGTFKVTEQEVGPVKFGLDRKNAELMANCAPAMTRACVTASIDTAVAALAPKLGARLADVLHDMKLIDASR